MGKGRRNKQRPPIPVKEKVKVLPPAPPKLEWREPSPGVWKPIISIGNIVMPCEERPFLGFYRGEREAILTWCKQALSEVFFDCPLFLVNESGKSAKNPDWDLLPYFRKVEREPLPEGVVDDRPVEWEEYQPKVEPTAAQQKAEMELPVET